MGSVFVDLCGWTMTTGACAHSFFYCVVADHNVPAPLQAVLVQELRWQQGAAGGGASGGPDPAAVAAKQAYLTVHAAVATHQLQLVGWPAGRNCGFF